MAKCLSSSKVALNAWAFIKKLKRPVGGVLLITDAGAQICSDSYEIGGQCEKGRL